MRCLDATPGTARRTLVEELVAGDRRAVRRRGRGRLHPRRAAGRSTTRRSVDAPRGRGRGGAGRRGGRRDRAEPGRRGLRVVPRGRSRARWPAWASRPAGAAEAQRWTSTRADFDVDERAIPIGVRVLAAAALCSRSHNGCAAHLSSGSAVPAASVIRARVPTASTGSGRHPAPPTVRRTGRMRRETPLARVTKLATALLAGALVLTRCGGTATTTPRPAQGRHDQSAPPSDIKVGLAYDIGGRGDQSFNDAAAAGLDKAKTELGVETAGGRGHRRRDRAAKEERLRAARRRRLQPGHRGRLRLRRGARQGRAGVPGHQVRDRRRRGVERRQHRQPGLRRGAGLLPRRCGGGAEDARRATSASSAVSRST